MSTSEAGAILCIICNSEGMFRCVQCRNVHYCSIPCQRKDWVTHQLLCSSFSSFREAPGPMFKRAILFPVDEGAAPKWVWVEVMDEWDEVMGVYREKPNLGALLGAEYFLECRKSFSTNSSRNRVYEDHEFEVVYREDNSELQPNKGIERVRATSLQADRGNLRIGHMIGRELIQFQEDQLSRGPVIALRREGKHVNDAYGHMTLGDFRDVVDIMIVRK